ncbi:restriction endonuclease [Bradyrhizobium frederickii]|uniref:Restriction endonuclease n=1 Tax=Bradyrhizobium frederickii TaxID=2560054 RepID=A0A4Y9PA97_9BRAD|nr:HNH endonuclease [Bradyrhizobium frederickii]TFV76392.1 restriction endonuclease [Bradyrhizobium frederickii]
MGFGVFIHRSDSIYDDSPAERYQFPSQYLRRVEACVNDWIIYYEPRKVAETRGYFAIARVQQVIPDPAIPGMYLALMEPGSYLDFVNPVPFSGTAGPFERGVLNEQGRISGRAQSAVRPISPDDFNRICELGLVEGVPLLPRRDDDVRPLDLNEEQLPFRLEQQRDRVSLTISRVLRDRVFRRIVLRAYDERCAITGLKLVNGMGRAEVAAAHIRPVEAHGPDIISNGIALSGTAHWMFDRGLISLADNLEILVSRQTNDPDGVRSIINKTGVALAPGRMSDRPHPHFLKWHREHCFKH